MSARSPALALASIVLLGLVAAAALVPQDRRPPPRQDPKSAPASSDDLDARTIERIEQIANEAAQQGEFSSAAIVVARGAEPLLARGYGYADAGAAVPTTEDTVLPLGELSRLYVNVAVLQLVQAKKLALDDEVAKLVPEFKTQENKVTLHHLLSHTSGIAHPKEAPERENDDGGGDGKRAEVTRAALIASFVNEPFEFAPGERYSPNEANTILLALILEQSTGLGLRECLEKNLFLPLGLRHTHLCHALLELTPEPAEATAPTSKADDEKKPEVDGLQDAGDAHDRFVRMLQSLELSVHASAQDVCASAMDLFLWQRALVDRAALDEETTRLLGAQFALPDGSEVPHGYGLSSADTDGVPELTQGPRADEARACVAYYPEADLTVVVLASGEHVNASELERRIARAALDLPDPGIVDRELSVEERAPFVGAYQIGTTRVVVLEQDARLVLQRPDAPDQRMLFQGRDTFVLEDERETTLVFKVENGRALEFVLRRRGFESIGKRFD